MGGQADALNERGKDAWREGKLPEAVQWFTQAAAATRDDVRPLGNRSACQLELGRAAEALADADAALAMRPRWAKGHVRRGAALAALCRYDDAAAAFDAALSLEPGNAAAAAGRAAAAAARDSGADERARGNAAFAARDYAAAARHYTAALRGPCDRAQQALLLSNRSAAHLALQHTQEALADASRAAELRPEWSKAQSRLGAARAAAGDAPGAKAAFAKALTLDAGNDAARDGVAAADAALAATGAKAAADAAFRTGDFAAAESGYALALRSAAPADAAVLHSNRSAALARLARWADALAAARAAIAARPGWARAHSRAVAALHGGGDAEAAYALAADALRGACAGSPELRAARDAALDAICVGDTTACAARARRFDLHASHPRAAVRVFATSDLHVDQHGNLAWCQAIHGSAFRNDVLVVAGDVGDTLNALRHGLRCLRSKFGRVFFSPGNHDLWVRPELEGKLFPDSVCKLLALLRLCDELDVDTAPARVAADVTVAPLFSWYNCAFDEADPRPGGLRYDKFATWPCADGDAWRLLTQRLNAPRLAALAAAAAAAPPLRPGAQPPVMLTASHFLPRAELPCAGGVPELAKAVGCKELDLHVAALRSDVHVYGHTHLNGDGAAGRRYVRRAADGALVPEGAPNETRYVQAALEGGARGLYCVFDRGHLAGRYYSHTTGAPI